MVAITTLAVTSGTAAGPPDPARALVEALLALFGVAAGPAVFASGLFACVALYTSPGDHRDARIAAAVDLGVAVAFPYGAVFGLFAFVYQLANVPS